MVLYPDVLKRAQAEVDSVVGRERMPSYGDQNNLPYIDAIVKEVLRWRPVAPLGQIHTSVQRQRIDSAMFRNRKTVCSGMPQSTQQADQRHSY